MNKIEKEIKNILDNNPNYFYIYLKNKLSNPISRLINKNKIINCIPLIVEKTSEDNCDWLDIHELLNDKNVIKSLIKNINKLSINGREFRVFSKVIDTISIYRDSLTQEELDIFLNICFKEGFINEMSYIDRLFVICDMNDVERKKELLEYSINSESSSLTTFLYLLDENLPIYHEILDKNFERIINNYKDLDLFFLKKRIINKSISEEVKNKWIKHIDNMIKNDSEHYLNINISNLYKRYYSNDELKGINSLELKGKFSNITDILNMMIKELSEYENVSLSDVIELGSGSYSTVLKIGDKVLKIGKNRMSKTFPNNPFINDMLLRKEFKVNDNISMYVEVSDLLDTKTIVTEEELYNLYKNLRDIGIIWTDISNVNVGRLIKDNNVSWKQELPITDNILGLSQYRKSIEKPKKGNIVIIDNDFLFDENDDEIIIGRHGLYEKFKERYDTEKKKLIEEKLKTIDKSLLSNELEIVNESKTK